MEGVYDIRHQMTEGLAAYQKQFYDSPEYQEQLRNEREAEKRKYEETIYQMRKDAERKERAHEQAIELLEKRKEKQSDRWFQAALLIIGAVLGVLLTKMGDMIFK